MRQDDTMGAETRAFFYSYEHIVDNGRLELVWSAESRRETGLDGS